MPSFAPDAISKSYRVVDCDLRIIRARWRIFSCRSARDDARAFPQFSRNARPDFGAFEDAMWSDEPFLYHSRLSALLNAEAARSADV